jgi:hypothetical protein
MIGRCYNDAAPTALKTGRAGRRETISPFRRRAFGLACCKMCFQNHSASHDSVMPPDRMIDGKMMLPESRPSQRLARR